MKPLQFNMSRFKKVAGDKNSTTLEHDDGHQLKVAHSKLSPEMRKQFMALEMKDKTPVKLAKGGEVKTIGEDDTSERKDPQWLQGMQATGDSVAADARDRYGASAPTPQFDPNTPAPAGVGAPTGAPQAIYDGSDIARTPMQSGPEGAPGQTNSISNAPSPDALHAAQASLPAPEAGAIPSANVPGPASPSAPVQPLAPQGPQMIGPPTNPNPPSMAQQGYGHMMEGADAKAKAEGAAGYAQAKEYDKAAVAQQKVMADFQTTTQNIMREREALMKDINNQHIDPKQYMNSLGSEGRTNVAIGLILGGMGGGGTTNLAADFLNKQIDRDIEAQKSELGKKQNLLTASFHHFGDMRMAADFTRVALNDQMLAKVNSAIQKAQDPLARAALEKWKGEKEMEQGVFVTKLSAMQTFNGSGNPDAQAHSLQLMRQLDPAQAKGMEERFVPGVGASSVPVPTAVRDKLVDHNNLDQMINRVQDFANKHGGTILDRTVVAEGKSLASQLQNAARAASNGGVFKKSEAEFLNTYTPEDPTSFFNMVKTNPQLKSLRNVNRDEMNGLKRGYGLPVQPDVATFQERSRK